MAYKLGADGKWTQIPETGGGQTGNQGTKVDNGNVNEKDDSIKETTANKEESIKYTETATAKILGATNARRGNWVVVEAGVADKWLGKWLILSCTHTVDQKGYTVDVNLGRKPGGGGGGKKGSSSTTSSSTPPSAKTATKKSSPAPAASKSDKVWKLQANGKWTQTEK